MIVARLRKAYVATARQAVLTLRLSRCAVVSEGGLASAWESVPQTSRPVRYGVIGAGADRFDAQPDLFASKVTFKSYVVSF